MLLGVVSKSNRAPQVRCYVASVSPPRIYPGKKMPRDYSVRKTFLFNQYTALLNRGNPILFLNHNNFSAKQLIKLRRDITAIKPSHSPPSLALSPSPIPPSASIPPEFTVIRTGILGVALREHLSSTQEQKRRLTKLITPGAVAMLTLPTLDPAQLAKIIRALERAVPPRKSQPTAEEAAVQAATRLAIVENPTPGRRQKRVRPNLPPELELKGALIEGRLFIQNELKGVSKLPSLETLRAQILGLISAPASQLARVLGEASGGQLARTLEGLKKGLEMDAVGDNIGSPQ